MYRSHHVNYVGAPLLKENCFDAKLVANVITEMKCGKTAGFDGITAEHLTNFQASSSDPFTWECGIELI
jgi:hypothetical protein